MPPVTAFLSLNYTGGTTFTSWSGVKREIFAYVPVMAWMFAPGLLAAGGAVRCPCGGSLIGEEHVSGQHPPLRSGAVHRLRHVPPRSVRTRSSFWHHGEVNLANRSACMECGACQINCAVEAVTVDSGVGCAPALMLQAVTKKKQPSCGC